MSLTQQTDPKVGLRVDELLPESQHFWSWHFHTFSGKQRWPCRTSQAVSQTRAQKPRQQSESFPSFHCPLPRKRVWATQTPTCILFKLNWGRKGQILLSLINKKIILCEDFEDSAHVFFCPHLLGKYSHIYAFISASKHGMKSWYEWHLIPERYFLNIFSFGGGPTRGHQAQKPCGVACLRPV